MLDELLLLNASLLLSKISFPEVKREGLEGSFSSKPFCSPSVTLRESDWVRVKDVEACSLLSLLLGFCVESLTYTVVHREV